MNRDQELKRFYADGGKELLFGNLPIKEGDIVADIGAYKGDTTAELFNRYKCMVVFFEPIQSYFDIANERFKENIKIHPYNCGLSNKTESVEISMEGDASSVYGNGNIKEEIQLIDAIDGLSALKYYHFKYAIINIEGGEYDLLDRLTEENGNGWKGISMFEQFAVQFHDVIPNAEERREQIREKLRETHDEVYSYPFVWEMWKRKQIK